MEPRRTEDRGAARITARRYVGRRICRSRPTRTTPRRPTSSTWPLAETCAAHLAKGRLVGVSARLEPTAWETAYGAKRRGMKVIAGAVEFLDHPRRDGDLYEQQSQDVAVAA
jgi:hypothetical protein